jgi:hypothetical protein
MAEQETELKRMKPWPTAQLHHRSHVSLLFRSLAAMNLPTLMYADME